MDSLPPIPPPLRCIGQDGGHALNAELAAVIGVTPDTLRDRLLDPEPSVARFQLRRRSMQQPWYRFLSLRSQRLPFPTLIEYRQAITGEPCLIWGEESRADAFAHMARFAEAIGAPPGTHIGSIALWTRRDDDEPVERIRLTCHGEKRVTTADLTNDALTALLNVWRGRLSSPGGRKPGSNPDIDPLFPGRYARALCELWRAGAVEQPSQATMAAQIGISTDTFERRLRRYPHCPWPPPWPPPDGIC